MTDTAPAESKAPAPRNFAQEQKTRLDSFMTSLAKRQESLGTLLEDSGVSPQRFLEVARRALTQNMDLLRCRPESLMRAFINCATDGLVPDGREAAITSFTMHYNKPDQHEVAQYMPMAQGLMKIAYRSERFLSIEARVVYQGDLFEYELGDTPFIRHKPDATAVANRKIIAAYSVAKATNGGVWREVCEKADLDKIRAVSRATKGPNKDWPEEMSRKAPLRRMWKYLPKTPAMERVELHDNETYDLGADLPAAQVKSLQPGFAKAIEHQPGEAAPGLSTAELDETLGGDRIPIDRDGEGAPAEGMAQGADPETPADAIEDAKAWAAATTRALESFDTAEEIDRALQEPTNKKRWAILMKDELAIAQAFNSAIADRKEAIAKAAGGGANG